MATYSPRDFESACPPPRIIGTEMEYYLQQDAPSADTLQLGLKSLGIASVGEFRSNGSRIYRSFGIEYAAPECAGPRDATLADFAGMTVINRLTTPDTPSEDSLPAFPVLRHAGSFDIETGLTETRGYHENFLTPHLEDCTERALFQTVLSSYLATRAIWNGEGLVTNNGFRLSQKATGIGAPVGDGYGSRMKHGKKPLAGYMGPETDARDKVSRDWGLLEIRSADAHMSKSQTFRSLAVTSLVMRLMEQKVIHTGNAEDFILESPVQSLHRINNSYGRRLPLLESGTRISARVLQERFAGAILDMAEKTTLPDDECIAAVQFMALCERLRGITQNSDMSPLVPDVPWATKLHYLQAIYGENAWEHRLSDAVAFDLQWHRIDARSVGLKVYDKYDPWHKEKDTDEWITQAPTNSRAAARGAAIHNGTCDGAGWGYVSFPNSPKVYLDDYWSPRHPKPMTTSLVHVA